ncbi:MFS transporter [Horticoccus sp. 23ND18S-11]|uniref:MFS transporter n=1 Tax=Horticoccus sp. 23ND18S-11 TaxID=3391832 RepID=UPI0039C96DFD
MNALRRHFVFGYAILGATGPYLPQFLRADRGLDDRSIGLVLAVSQLPVFLSPVLMTYLADRHTNPRMLALATTGFAGLALIALSAWQSLGGVMLASAAYSFALAALLPSMDGLCFAWIKRRIVAGETPPPYHRFRMLGTVGYIVPALVLLVVLRDDRGLAWVIYTAAAFAAVAALNSFLLPDPRDRSAVAPVSKLPTMDALRVMFSRRWIWLSVALGLLQVGNSCFSAVFPVHLTENLGVDARWLGLISSLGVLCEVPLIFGLGWLTGRFGLRPIMLLGAGAAMIRLGVLAAVPLAGVAIAAQVLHGFVTLGTLIAPVVFVNRLAGDGFRNSIQGVLAVAVYGPCKLVAPLLNGWLAQIDDRLAFGTSAALALVAAGLLWRCVPDGPEEGAVVHSPTTSPTRG